jgi:DNA (cytosine-5)-methyltransferase 1
VQAVTGGRLVAVAEHAPPPAKVPKPPQAAARLLAHHYPTIPNLGDVSRIDWAPWRGRVSGITGGFPCQDVSHAGLQAGLAVGTRSGLWYEFARAIVELQPALVVIENVTGLRSARAGDPEEVTDEEAGDVEPGAGGLGDAHGRDARPVQLRALGAVLGDLAELGFDAEWVSIRASDVGAAHRRERVFVMAYRRDLSGFDRGGGRSS